MSGKHEAERDGREEAVTGGVALRVASRGLGTIRDCANFTAAISIDALTGHVGGRNGNLAIRGMEATRRFIESGQRHGQHSEVLDRVAPADGRGREEAEDEALRRREAELTAELEALRERRGG